MWQGFDFPDAVNPLLAIVVAKIFEASLTSAVQFYTTAICNCNNWDKLLNESRSGHANYYCNGRAFSSTVKMNSFDESSVVDMNFPTRIMDSKMKMQWDIQTLLFVTHACKMYIELFERSKLFTAYDVQDRQQVMPLKLCGYCNNATFRLRWGILATRVTRLCR